MRESLTISETTQRDRRSTGQRVGATGSSL